MKELRCPRRAYGSGALVVLALLSACSSSPRPTAQDPASTAAASITSRLDGPRPNGLTWTMVHMRDAAFPATIFETTGTENTLCYSIETEYTSTHLFDGAAGPYLGKNATCTEHIEARQSLQGIVSVPIDDHSARQVTLLGTYPHLTQIVAKTPLPTLRVSPELLLAIRPSGNSVVDLDVSDDDGNTAGCTTAEAPVLITVQCKPA
jgi:hypothetical protein